MQGAFISFDWGLIGVLLVFYPLFIVLQRPDL